MFKPTLPLICGALLLLLSAASAVINNNANQSNQEAQRREAPLADSYGPPPATGPELPAPVYGAPAAAHYPPPPPDVPPPAPVLPSVQVPHKEYGVPVQNYGPPNVNIEYGPPPVPASKPVYHSYPKPPQYHGPPPSHHKKSSSFLEQLFSTFGFGGSNDDHHHHHAPKPSYGPPPHPAPVYGPPLKPVYGPPPAALAPQPVYGPPIHQAPPKPHYGPPKPAYGPPLQSGFAVQSASFGHQSSTFGHHPASPVHAPPTPPEIKCDGWKPIAGPVVQPEVHAPESSYGPPPSGDFLGSHHQLESGGVSVSSSDIGLQLPKLEHGPVFNAHSEHHSELELSKGNNYEVHSNFISDSYGAPPSDSFLPGKYKPSFAKPLAPPPPPPPQKLHFPPSPHYGPPLRHPGLGISHGSISGNLKPWPVSGSPPRHPIAYRPPVPQGLIESIGHAVEHQENFGTKPSYSGDVYLPPPTRDVAHSGPSSLELNVLPSEQPAQPFLTQHQLPEPQTYVQEPRYQSHDVVSVSSDCGHGPTSVDVQQSIQTNQLSIVGPSATASYSADYSNGHSLQEHYDGASSTRHVQTSSLPGLDGGIGGLELISAQKSQSLTIPVQGQRGSYQLQFQSADPQGSGSAPHEQILSEGLLQSILSAIEQPQQHRATEDQESYDPNIDHSEVSVFLKSPEGQKTLQDHPNGHIGHKR
ncbi:extensin-like [Anopheles stephensi]|uniref:extensin-like n=1 Tax=Anopheles stephensi TaxID=30069 RepID=UPI0016587D1C|nr:extensin-like [Anopheles stephensi]